MKLRDPSWIVLLALLTSAASPATRPATVSSEHDAGLDFLMGVATTSPTSQPAADTTVPANSPLVAKGSADPDVRTGTITLNDGKVITGQISTTPGKPLRLWDENAKEYHDVPLRLVKAMKAHVVWERDEPEWRFKESGSDIKVNTGKTYPARELTYVFTLNDGRTVEGGIAAPLFVQIGDEQQTLILHKRDKGDVGKSLKELEYVAEASFQN